MNDAINLFLKELKEKNLLLLEENRFCTASRFVSNIEEKAKKLSLKRKRVYFSLDRSIESFEWLFALLKSEALVFLGSSLFSHEKLKFLFDYLQPHLAILPHFQASRFDSAAMQNFTDTLVSLPWSSMEELDPQEQLAQIGILTSGTTGSPRAVLHRFSSLLLNASLHAKAIQLSAIDRVGSALPLHFSYGLVAVALASLVQGASLFFAPSFIPGDPLIWMKDISVFSATPLLAKKLDQFPSRILTIGGDYTPTSLAEKILHQAPNTTLLTTYGLTEAGPRVATCNISLGDCALASLPLGEFLPSIETQIAQDQELLIKTPSAMLGYFRGKQETDQVFTNGWLHTGDLVKKQENQLYFLGRKKRLLSLGGEKIYPAEVESLLQKIPSIEDAYVTQEADTIVAYLQTNKPPTEKTVSSFLRNHLPRAQIPTRIEFVANLPIGARKK